MARLATETVKVELKPTDRRLLARIAKALEKIAEGGPPMGLTFSQVAKEAPPRDTFFDGDDTPFHTSTPSGRPIETL